MLQIFLHPHVFPKGPELWESIFRIPGLVTGYFYYYTNLPKHNSFKTDMYSQHKDLQECLQTNNKQIEIDQ